MTIETPAPGANGLAPVPDEPTIGQLVASATEDLSSLVRSEVALAKAEVGRSAKQAVIGGAFFGVAGYLVFMASILLTIAFAFGLIAAGLPPWAAFLIVAAVFLLLAGVSAYVGKRRMARVRAPEQSIDSIKKTVAAVKPTA